MVIDIDLHKSFGANSILKGVNLKVAKGESVVVLGKSGSGKSVTIKCLVGSSRPTRRAQRFWHRCDSAQQQSTQRATCQDGILFQTAALYDSMSVRENLGFTLRHHNKELSADEIEQATIAALQGVGLEEAIDKMPSELSGGMRKRIGLARTMIIKPEIMLYDEPTTGLDTITSREISELILELQSKNKTTSIIITHDMPCARLTADRIVILKEGVIAAEGTYEELEKVKTNGYAHFLYNPYKAKIT
jgi:phospholipid/cholesterol/gamma-HCH transport system ATP-binding protein